MDAEGSQAQPLCRSCIWSPNAWCHGNWSRDHFKRYCREGRTVSPGKGDGLGRAWGLRDGLKLRSSFCTKIRASKQKIAKLREISKRLDSWGKMGKTLPQIGTSWEGGPSRRDEASIHCCYSSGKPWEARQRH